MSYRDRACLEVNMAERRDRRHVHQSDPAKSHDASCSRRRSSSEGVLDFLLTACASSWPPRLADKICSLCSCKGILVVGILTNSRGLDHHATV